ncbi:protein FAM200C-like [Oratosquilla oratoria]|uniref:protein FAM200C-like n=1 Tax=Oratosquilla oratoria TaxID=337810 RepID=UPI003F77605B
MAFARIVDVDGIREELIFALKLTIDNNGESIFTKLESYFEENNIPLKIIVACAPDGAAAMVGRYRGFSAYLKKAVTNVVCVHCVVHRHHLVAKNLAGRLHEALRYVIEAVNLIKKNALHDRLFQQLCGKNNEEFERLVLHTEFVEPFIADASEVDVTLQEIVIELQKDTTARAGFKRGGRHKLWIYQDVYEKYPLFWKLKLLLLAFPKSYLVETGFSRVMHLLSKTRNCLDIGKRRFTSSSDISGAKYL